MAFLREESGVTAIAYGLFAALIAIIVAPTPSATRSPPLRPGRLQRHRRHLSAAGRDPGTRIARRPIVDFGRGFKAPPYHIGRAVQPTGPHHRSARPAAIHAARRRPQLGSLAGRSDLARLQSPVLPPRRIQRTSPAFNRTNLIE